MVTTSLVFAFLWVCSPGLQDATEERDPIRRIHARYQEESRNVNLATSEARQKFFGHWFAEFETAARRQPNTPAVRLAKDEMCVFLCALDRHREAYALREVLLAESISNLDRGGHLTQWAHCAARSHRKQQGVRSEGHRRVRQSARCTRNARWYGLQQKPSLLAVFDDHGKAVRRMPSP